MTRTTPRFTTDKMKFEILICLPLFLSIVSSAFTTYSVDDSKGLGRRFDGIGGLSGGGATSKLLVNYPDEQRDQIYDFLFKPNFGASLHMLKVEIGGDSQSTDGSEASHMHYSWDENYQRGYEWGILKEAKKRNPDILLYCLPWAFPAWVGNGTRNPYHSPEITASYIVKYILGAQAHHNLTFDFVGIWNERSYNIKYIEVLRAQLNNAGLQHVKIVAADGAFEPISTDINKNPTLKAAVDYIGVHYPGTKGSDAALKTGKQLWSSEDFSTFNDNVGAGCWARILNQNYVNGNMTSTISWNLIASYYEALPFARDGLMTAESPWSGHYTVENTIWMTAHTTQFSQPGWMYTKHGMGVSLLEGGGSFVTLQSPDKKDFTIIIETMSRNHSVCIRPFLPEYNVTAQNITLKLSGSFAKVFRLNVWYSKLGFDGKESTLMDNLGAKPVIGGIVNLNLGLDEVITLTTLNTGSKGQYPDPPPKEPFPLPYTDDFELNKEFSEPFNLAQQTGTYEVITTKSSHRNVIRQMMTDFPCNWCEAEKVNRSVNIVGNSSWSDIYVEADAMVSPVNGTSGVFIAARIDKGGCGSFASQGIFFFVFPKKRIFDVYGDLARTMKLFEGKIPGSQPIVWSNMGLLVKDGRAVGTLNNITMFNITAPASPKNGFVGLGTAEYGLADFDNLRIDTAESGLKRIQENKEFVKNCGGSEILKQAAVHDGQNKDSIFDFMSKKSNSVPKEIVAFDTIEDTVIEKLNTYNDAGLESDTLYFKSLRKRKHEH